MSGAGLARQMSGGVIGLIGGNEMPRAKVTGAIVSHIWDDDSRTDIEIRSGKFEDTGHYVSVKDDNQTIYFRPESWGEIRDQIQAMIDEIED